MWKWIGFSFANKTTALAFCYFFSLHNSHCKYTLIISLRFIYSALKKKCVCVWVLFFSVVSFVFFLLVCIFICFVKNVFLYGQHLISCWSQSIKMRLVQCYWLHGTGPQSINRSTTTQYAPKVKTFFSLSKVCYFNIVGL